MKQRRASVRRGGGGRTRSEIVGQVLAVLAALAKPHTAAELAAHTGLHVRTVYRILRALPEAGIGLRVTEPKHRGPGRPVRFYRRT